jgi:hypothetical protein
LAASAPVPVLGALSAAAATRARRAVRVGRRTGTLLVASIVLALGVMLGTAAAGAQTSDPNVPHYPPPTVRACAPCYVRDPNAPSGVAVAPASPEQVQAVAPQPAAAPPQPVARPQARAASSVIRTQALQLPATGSTVAGMVGAGIVLVSLGLVALGAVRVGRA